MIHKPIGKVITIGALGGALGTVTVWAYNTLAGIHFPAFLLTAEPAMSLQVLITFLLQWWIDPVQLEGQDEDGDKP